MPLTAWYITLNMRESEPALPGRKREALRAVFKVMPSGGVPPRLPFTVGDPPRLNVLEQHLLDIYTQDPAKGRPLIVALIELNQTRQESWLLAGLTNLGEAPPEETGARAWLLAGELYRWGNNLDTADVPFDAEKLRQNGDAIRAIFSSPALADARRMIGEYLVRQSAETQESALPLEVLPQDLFAQHRDLLMALVSIETEKLGQKETALVRGLVERFPLLKTTGVLSRALRRNSEFESALAELPGTKPVAEAERLLIEVRIADAFQVELPEDAEQQRQLAARLNPLKAIESRAAQEVASNLMRTDISRAIRQRARELGKTWGYCRNLGLGSITSSILNAVSLHLTRK